MENREAAELIVRLTQSIKALRCLKAEWWEDKSHGWACDALDPVIAGLEQLREEICSRYLLT